MVAKNFRPPFIPPPENTDTNGEAVFHLPEGDVLVEVKDENTSDPLAGISLGLVSNGQKVLVLATDPNENYLPNFAEEVVTPPQADLSTTTGAGYAAIIPIALKVWGAAEAALALIDIAEDPPRIEDFHLGSSEYCLTPDQVCDVMTLALFIAKLPFKLSPAASVVLFATAKVGKAAACQQLRSRWDAQALPDPLKIRFYHSLSIPVVELAGLCSGPQETPFRIGPLARDYNGCSSVFSVRNPHDTVVFVCIHFEPGRDSTYYAVCLVVVPASEWPAEIVDLEELELLWPGYCGWGTVYSDFDDYPHISPAPGPPVQVTMITQCTCP